jgi:hypothetical protein
MNSVRLARAIAEIDHPQVCGTLDFSHAYIMTTWRGMDYIIRRSAAPSISATLTS